MFFVMIGWTIFQMADISSGVSFFGSLFHLAGNVFAADSSIYLLYTNAILMIILVIGCSDLPAKLARKMMKKLRRYPAALCMIQCLFYVIVFLLSVAYLVDATYNPFLYFRF